MQMTMRHYHPEIAPFMEYLEGLTARPALEEVLQKMQAFNISTTELGESVQFHSNHYRRNLIFENEHVQLLCLCWKIGQRSPIHDHAKSICGVKVITGIASETIYEVSPSGYIKPISTVDYPEGAIGSKDSDIHQVSNLQSEHEDLVTLHRYAPPLKKMKTFSSNSKYTQVYEPGQ
ncbi:MAG: cysteine dioxygenase [Cryomorphaceae bacterium]|jgi:cysteine dioxygenase